MDASPALSLAILMMSLFGSLALAASFWGSDSRPRIGDDHAR